MKIKITITSLFCFLIISVFSQDLVQKDNGFEIKYNDKELNQQGLEIGSDFPFDGLVDIDGNELEKEKFKEKIVVVNFWFIGCGGCKQQKQYLSEVTKHFSDKSNIEFISICANKKDKIIKYYKKKGDFGYRTFGMNRKEMEGKFKVKTSPTHWFFKNGKLVDKLIWPIYSDEVKNWMINYINDLET